MSAPNYILYLTVQHTGTWFLATALGAATGYRLVQLALSGDEYTLSDNSRTPLVDLEPKHIVHAHIPLPSHYVGKRLDNKTANPLRAYRDTTIAVVNQAHDILQKIGTCRVLITVRDVLLSLISRQMRSPSDTHEYQVDGFVLAALEFMKFDPAYYCIDLFDDEHDRLVQMGELRDCLDFGIDQFSLLAVKQMRWKRINPTQAGPNMLKDAYEQGNTRHIQDVLHWDWRYLIKHRSTLQPFYESLGYRDLLWFEGNA